MKHQLEFNETELLALATKQLIREGRVPETKVFQGTEIPIMTYPYKSKETDDEGQSLFYIRWEE